MKTICFVNQKGGVGKSVLALNLAVVAEREGEKVAVFDLDPQGTISNWYDIRTAETPAVVGVDQVGPISPALKRLEAAGYSVVVIDTQGHDAAGIRPAMEAADLCLVPVPPAGPELHASRKTIDALRAMGRNYALVINMASPNKAARLTEHITTSLSQSSLVLPIAMAQRMDFKNAYALGQGVVEYDPEGKAAEEMRGMWAWVRKSIDKEFTKEGSERGAA